MRCGEVLPASAWVIDLQTSDTGTHLTRTQVLSCGDAILLPIRQCFQGDQQGSASVRSAVQQCASPGCETNTGAQNNPRGSIRRYEPRPNVDETWTHGAMLGGMIGYGDEDLDESYFLAGDTLLAAIAAGDADGRELSTQ